MPPKKGKGKGKKKAKTEDNGEDGGGLTDKQKFERQEKVTESLKLQLAHQRYDTNQAVQERKTLAEKVDKLGAELNEEKQTYVDITQDMTRQYKGMQEELLNRVNTLENTITNLKDQLELSRVALEETKREKDQIIATKEAEIAEMKAKMEEMAHEFGDMLKETLDKMKEKIEVTNSSFEPETGVPIIRRLDEFNLSSAYKS